MQQSESFRSTFFVLDFDRCIGDTDKAHEILWNVIEHETGISTHQLQSVKDDLDMRGLNFNTPKYVTEELERQKSRKTWQDVRQVYVEKAQQQGILMPDAGELLAVLDNHAIPYGILTYGEELWQLTKLEAAGLLARQIPFEITRIERKGEILREWKRGNVFMVPAGMTRDSNGVAVEELIFLDDKPRSFESMPNGVRGVCVRPVAQPLRPSQQGVLPVEVVEVQGIRGAIDLLF